MKLFTFLCAYLLTTALYGQFVIVNDPPAIAGIYDFSAASFGADLSSDIWTADAVFVDDGTANPTLGCEDLINGAEVAGKIALIDRGSCNFSVKCFNAQEQGAIAAIVFNNLPDAGAFPMGAGTVGDQVSIPCVMLSYEDGQLMRGELANGPVNITIGAFKFPNDIGTDFDGVLRARNGVMPAVQAEALGYMMTPGVLVTNKGENDATDITLQTTIFQEPLPPNGSMTHVYSETVKLDLLEADSAEVLFAPDFTPGSYDAGLYTIQYDITSDSVDDVTIDNVAHTQFVLSENVYAKSGWDFDNNRPARTNSYTISGGGDIEFLSGFRVPVGEGYRLDSLQFYVSTQADSLGALEEGSVRAFVYEWTDLNEDGAATNDELEIVAISLVELTNTGGTNEWLKVGLLGFPDLDEGYVIPGDDRMYFAGVRYEGPESVFFGFDEDYDQTQYVNQVAETDLDLPYIGINGWLAEVPDIDNGFMFAGFRGSVSTAMIINPIDDVAAREPLLEDATVALFPNPASSQMTVELELKERTESLLYEIRDAKGRLVSVVERGQTLLDRTTIDVEQLPPGAYYLMARTDRGVVSRLFSVQR